jgi:Zn-dependent protease
MFSLVRMNEALALFVASLAVAIVFGFSELISGNLVSFGIVSLVAVLAMVPHELAHRWSARRLGCYSRYVLSPIGLLLTLATAPFSIKVIMPGYTLVISHYYDPAINKRIEGVTSFAGPVVNIVSASITYLAFILCLKTLSCPLILYKFLYWNTALNAWVAFFNLLPIPPLDGSKIIRWNPILWIISLVISLALLIVMII